MAEHGYARDYDEPIDRGTDDRDRWRSEDRQPGWRGSGGEWDSRDQRDRNERNVNFMLGDRDRSWERDDRYGDRQSSSFRDDDRQYRGTHGASWDQRDRGMSRYARNERNFGSQQDDHYISWRNRQLEALDRDYDDYCREREQQFHRDFDSWRQNRNVGQPGSQQGQSSEEIMELNNPTNLSTEPDSGPSPVGDATLGTNNDENTARGRR